MDNERKRNASISFRCTIEEKELLQQRSKYARLSMTDYILKLSNKKKIVVIEGLPELVKEINKIGVNINQISRIANQYKTVSDNQIQKVIDGQKDIQNSLFELMKKMSQKE